MKLKDAPFPSFWSLAIASLLLLSVAIYYPTLFGKVPLPNDIALRFAPFAGLQDRNHDLSYANLGDLITLAYPFRAFAAHSIREGILPLWNPYILLGSPFVANSQSAVFYPFNWIAYVLPLPTAWSLGLIVRMFLAGLFMVLFIRALGGSKTGSLVAGILFAPCGFLTAWQGWAIGDAAIWLPLICYAVHRLHEAPSNAAVAIAGLAFAMPILAGHPETAAHLTLTGVFMAALLWASDLSKKNWGLGFLARFTLAGLLALGVAAIQLLPTLEWIQELAPMLAAPWPALQPDKLLGFVSRDILRHPNSAGLLVPENAAYLGMMTLPAAALAVFHHRRRYVVFLAALTIIAGCVAYSIGPIHSIVASTPILQGIRNGRLILVVSFGLISLAGMGISALENVSRPTRRKALFALGVGFLLSFSLVYALQQHTTIRVEWIRRPSFSRALLFISVIPIVFRLYGRLGSRLFLVLVCAIAAIDAVTFSHGYTGFADPKDIFPPAPLFEFLATHNDPSRFRIAGLSDPYPINATMMYGIPSVDGYDIPLQRPQILTRGLRPDNQVGIGLSERGVLLATDRRLDLLNVKYLVTTTLGNGFETLKRREQFALVFQMGDIAVFENKTVLPRAFAVPNTGIEIIENIYDQLGRLREPSFNPERSVVLSMLPLSMNASPQPSNNAFTSEIAITEDKSDAVVFRAYTSASAILVISQAYYPGWKATVDGSEAPVIPVDLALTGITVPAGTHEVRLTLQPTTFYLGAAMTVLALASISGLFAIRAYRPRKYEHAAQILAASVGVVVVVAAAAVVSSHADYSTSASSDKMVLTKTMPMVLNDNQGSIALVGGEELQSGYADFEGTQPGGVSALALLKYSEAGQLKSETGIPSQSPAVAGVVPYRLDENYNTAIAVTNPSDTVATFSFSAGSANEPSRFEIPSRGEISVFVDEPPFRVKSSRGPLTWQSTIPIFVTALLAYHDENHPLVLANIPVATAASAERSHVSFVPPTARSRELVVVNPTVNTLTGSLEWYSVDGQLTKSVRYSVPAWSSNVYADDTSSPSVGSWIDVAPDTGQLSPESILTCLLEENEMISLIAIRATRAVEKARVYAEVSTATRTAIAIANPNPIAAHVNVGSEIIIPPRESMVIDVPVGKIIQVLSSAPIAITVLRNHVNNGMEYLSTAYPADLGSGSIFSHFTAGGPFSTDIVLFGSEGATVSGVLRLFSHGGAPVALELGK